MKAIDNSTTYFPKDFIIFIMCVSVVYKGLLYIWGGFNGLLNRHFGDLHCYNPANREWTEVKVSGIGPCCRRRQSACLVEDKLYLFGGTSPFDKKAETRISQGKDLLDHSDLHVLDFSECFFFLSSSVHLYF